VTPPAPPRRRLEIVPAGGVSVDFLEALGRELDARLGTGHVVAPPLALDPAWSAGRRKLRSAPLLDALLARGEEEGVSSSAGWRLAVTGASLEAPEVGRVFGEAAVGSGCAVVGLGGLDAGKRCGAETLLLRAVKEAVHELGHAAGLAHCADPLCVMYPSLHIADTDRKAERFCARCQGDFRNATLDAARS
jgi:predicted Zn-dependent protease